MASGDGVLIGAVEGGGTKFVCAVARSPLNLLDRAVIPTRDPVSTLSECIDFFRAASRRHGDIAAISIATFGPLQLRRDARDYGCLLGTPKAGWSGVSVLAPFSAECSVPLLLDTDVASAAHGELAFGAGRGRESFAYVTVGTGIGGAVAPAPVGARLMHAEMGHSIVRRDSRDAGFDGICPYHGDCLEGLASGPAIRARWRCDLSQLPPSHPGRDIIAGYLGQLIASIALMHSPEIVVLGGGVMTDGALLPRIREATQIELAGYLPPLRDAGNVERFIQAPALGGDSAIAGAIQLALDFLAVKQTRS
jgi:fructokinase